MTSATAWHAAPERRRAALSWSGLLARIAPDPTNAHAQAPAPIEARRPGAVSGPGLRLPSPRISALLVLVFLGFGALLGSAGSPRRQARRVGRPGAEARRPPRREPALHGHRLHGHRLRRTAPNRPNPNRNRLPLRKHRARKRSSTGTNGSKGRRRRTGKGSREAGERLGHIRPEKALGHQARVRDRALRSALRGRCSGRNRRPATWRARSSARASCWSATTRSPTSSWPNGVALLSGQGPTAQTAANCPIYTDLSPGNVGGQEQALGDGCVYPPTVENAARAARRQAPQLAGLRAGDGRTGLRRRAPAPILRRAGRPDPSALGRRLRHVPQSLRLLRIDHRLARPAQADDVGLDRLKADLAAVPRARRASPTSSPTAATTAARRPARRARRRDRRRRERLPRRVVPEILASKAYRKDGLLVITVRRGSLERRIRRLELLLRAALLTRTSRPRDSATAAAARSARCCSRPSSRAPRRPRNRTTTTRCCGRSRTSSASATSATRRCRPSRRSAPRC